LAAALTPHQLLNQLYHALGALAISSAFPVAAALWPAAQVAWWFGIPATLLVALSKEFIEDRSKAWRDKPHKFFDSIFDVLVWAAASVVPYVVLSHL